MHKIAGTATLDFQNMAFLNIRSTFGVAIVICLQDFDLVFLIVPDMFLTKIQDGGCHLTEVRIITSYVCTISLAEISLSVPDIPS